MKKKPLFEKKMIEMDKAQQEQKELLDKIKKSKFICDKCYHFNKNNKCDKNFLIEKIIVKLNSFKSYIVFVPIEKCDYVYRMGVDSIFKNLLDNGKIDEANEYLAEHHINIEIMSYPGWKNKKGCENEIRS